MRFINFDNGFSGCILIGKDSYCAFLLGSNGYWTEIKRTVKLERNLPKLKDKCHKLIDKHCLVDHKYNWPRFNSRQMRIVRHINRLDKLIQQLEEG